MKLSAGANGSAYHARECQNGDDEQVEAEGRRLNMAIRVAPEGKSGPQRETLVGSVERVTFHNADTGFAVLKVKARGRRDLVPVVGHAASISAGEYIHAVGVWLTDRTHGLQFKATC